MNNITETEQQRAYRKHKNEIVGLIFLNICPVYAVILGTAFWVTSMLVTDVGDEMCW